MKQGKQFKRPLLMAIVMLVGMLMPKGAWAQSPVTVDGQGFQTIQEAIDEIVWGGRYDATLTLHQDFTLGDVETIDIYFNAYSEDLNFTIDLNGHTITGGCDWDNNSIGFANYGEGLPTVTIDNSCQDKKGKLFNCRLDLNENTKVIVNEGVSIYPSFELLNSAVYVVSINYETSSVENYGDIYGGVMVNFGGSFINNGSVAYVNGEFENNGGYCAYFNWADDGSSFSAFVNGGVYDYIEGDEDYSITSVVTKEPTCTEPGVRTVTGTCWGFTDTKEVEIPACHIFDNKTLTNEPVEDGLYAYVCDRDCGAHSDDHIIKDFNGEDNHLELTKSGSAYSTSENITLADANGFVSPVDFTAASVTYTRTGIKNQWGTIVVPFDVTGSDKYDFYTLTRATNEELNLTKVDCTLAAGTPALVRINTELVTGQTYNLELNSAEGTVTVNADVENGSSANGLTLTGSYSVKEITSENGYIISNNKFWSIQEVKGDNNVYCAPFRAYIASSAPASAKALNISISEEADAIEAINAITSDDAEYYDLNGRKLTSLQTGVNIVKYSNGKTKKVTIK